MIGIEPLMRLLNTPESVFDEAMRYAAVVCGGVGVTILYNMCASFMRSLGNGRMPLVFLTISCVLNIALDTLFVVVLHIGVVGTALATLIAQCISALLSMAYIARARLSRSCHARRIFARRPACGRKWRRLACRWG